MLKEKKTIIIIGAVFGVYLFLVLIIFGYYAWSKKSQNQRIETATPTSTMANHLYILETDPADGAENIPFDQIIKLQFSRSPLSGEYSVSLKEDDLYGVYYSLETKGNTVFVHPKTPLKEAKLYSLKVSDKNGRAIEKISFTTQVKTIKENTRPVELITQTEQQTKQERPDIFLANQLPHESNTFQMHLEIDSDSNFVFMVESKQYSGLALVDQVQSWLMSLGLTADQISTLNIQYR